MKNVELIQVALEDIGAAEPTIGREIVFQNVRYRIIEARPPKEGVEKAMSTWARRTASFLDPWSILARTR